MQRRGELEKSAGVALSRLLDSLRDIGTSQYLWQHGWSVCLAARPGAICQLLVSLCLGFPCVSLWKFPSHA